MLLSNVVSFVEVLREDSAARHQEIRSIEQRYKQPLQGAAGGLDWLSMFYRHMFRYQWMLPDIPPKDIPTPFTPWTASSYMTWGLALLAFDGQANRDLVEYVAGVRPCSTSVGEARRIVVETMSSKPTDTLEAYEEILRF